MNTTKHHPFSSHKTAVISTIICMLAMMVLVVSCPLKRMLLNYYVSNTSSAAKTNHSIHTQSAANHINNSPDCFLSTDKIFTVNQELSITKTLPFPLYLPGISKQSGFDYWLIDLHYNQFNVATDPYTELPLYLQHLQLII